MKILESERLYLRELIEDDIDYIFKLHNDQQVMTYMPYKNITCEKAINDTKSYIELGKKHPGFGIWATILKEDELFIGWTCLKPLGDTGEIEIGYRYLPEYWNKGYCTEICKKVLEYGFTTQNLNRIVAIVHPENGASVRVLEKIGMQYIKMVNHFDMDLKYYILEKNEWGK